MESVTANPPQRDTNSTQTSVTLLTFESDYHLINKKIQKQNRDLIEQLSVCRGAILRLENAIELCHVRIDEHQLRIER